MKAKFRNFTPHAINLNNGTVIESEGIARVAVSFTDFDENMTCSQEFGEVEGLPEKEEGVCVIVSLLVLQASDRDDLVAPASGHPECVRNEKGQIVSVPGFVHKTKPGTLEWFNSIMNRSEFVIEKDQCGTSCMFLKTIENDGTETYRFLCSKDHNNGVRFGAYDITKDGYIIERPEGEEGYGLFDVHMTPDCKKAVSNMIMKAKDKFKEWYENQ